MTAMAMELVLTVRHAGTAHVYRFNHDEIWVGSASGCDVRLPDARVAERHLRFERSANGYVVIDAGSPGGTHLAGELLSANKPRPIKSADLLMIGPYRIDVFLDEGTGLTTDNKETTRMAKDLADALRADSSSVTLTVSAGAAAGRIVPILPSRPLVVGAGSGCDLVVPEAASRHLIFALGAEGLILKIEGPPVRIRGKICSGQAHLIAGDQVELTSGAILEIGGLVTEPPPPRWTALELTAVVASICALLGAIWLAV